MTHFARHSIAILGRMAPPVFLLEHELEIKLTTELVLELEVCFRFSAFPPPVSYTSRVKLETSRVKLEIFDP